MRKDARANARKLLNERNSQPVRVPQIPIEWYGINCWRLPSGKALAEFALQAGFLAPLLFKSEAPASQPVLRGNQLNQAEQEGHFRP